MTDKALDTTVPAGSRLSYWIGRTLKRTREEAGISVSDIARPLGIENITITRLEAGKRFGRDMDRYIAGYAFVLGLEDGRELWKRALADYYRHGTPPVFIVEEGPASAFAHAIRDVVLRRKVRDAEQSSSRPATRKRRASG